MFLLLLTSIQFYGQEKDDAKKAKELYEQKVQSDLDERIQTFVSELNADDFQKEIIKQNLQSYYQEKKSILQSDTRYVEKEEHIKTLDATHFLDLKEMVSENTMVSIQNFIKDNLSELKKQKKKKKKKSKNDN